MATEKLSDEPKVLRRQLIQRWKQCLRVLKGLSEHEREKHFDMGTFGQRTDCGTVACAAGQCGLDPWFRERGFHLRFTLDARYGWIINETKFLPRVFFGNHGYAKVFLRTRASYERTLLNVRQQIKWLRTARDSTLLRDAGFD